MTPPGMDFSAKIGGLGRARQLFGDGLPTLLADLNERLAA